MKKELLDVLFRSEKRKGVLLLLQDGSKEMDFLLRSLNTNRQALLPQMKILEEHHLISHQRDTYELTTIGKLLVDEMAPLVSTVETFDIDTDYWGTHKLDFIPPYLLERINELGKCDIVNPSVTDMYEFNKYFYESSKLSRSVFRVSSYLHPLYSILSLEVMKRGVQLYLIVSREVIDRVLDKPDRSFEKLLENDLFNLFVYPDKMDLMSFAYNDYYFLMRLLKSNAEVDHKYILCSDQSALEWGKELFGYYLKDSVPVNEI